MPSIETSSTRRSASIELDFRLLGRVDALIVVRVGGAGGACVLGSVTGVLLTL